MKTLGQILFGIGLTLLIGGVVSYFWEEIEYHVENMLFPVTIVGGGSILGTLILFAGGFVPFLKIIALIVGILSSIVGIILGLKKLNEAK